MNDLVSVVRAVLTITPARWTDLAQTLPPEQLVQRPAPGEWSAVECLQHLIDVEKVFQFRLEAFMTGRDFPAFDPDEEGFQPAASSAQALAEEFARLRRQSLAALERLAPADLPRRSQHAELGPVTLEQMLNEWAAHDFNHVLQAEEALMQPFIRGCGPWQTYFTSHVIGG